MWRYLYRNNFFFNLSYKKGYRGLSISFFKKGFLYKITESDRITLFGLINKWPHKCENYIKMTKVLMLSKNEIKFRRSVKKFKKDIFSVRQEKSLNLYSRIVLHVVMIKKKKVINVWAYQRWENMREKKRRAILLEKSRQCFLQCVQQNCKSLTSLWWFEFWLKPI